MMDYLEQMIEFGQTHEPIPCYYCGRPIIPGNRVWIRKPQAYCSLECACARALGIEPLDFKAGDKGENWNYRKNFPTKRKSKAEE